MPTSQAVLADPSNQKLRGGYYTPSAISRFLAKWAIRNSTDEILEPSCGDGALMVKAVERLKELGAKPIGIGRQFKAIELYRSEAWLTRERLQKCGIPVNGTVEIGDFFEIAEGLWGLSKNFDVVLGNPPFLRYHSFPEEQRIRAFRIMRSAGLNPTRLTNSWVAFLVAASLRLKEDGRLAMVIPAELLQVNYAAQTRAFLAQHFGAITIITFRKLVFEGIQQEVVLLLAEKRPAIESGIDVIELEDLAALDGYEVKLRNKRHLKSIDHAEEKWLQYYLTKKEIGLLRVARARPDITRFGTIASVDVGVVTGNNRFFVLNEAQIAEFNLKGYTIPIVGRTAQLQGIVLTTKDASINRESGSQSHLLNLPALESKDMPPAVQRYVTLGEEHEAHTGFKCRNRKLWYVVPSVWVPDAFLFRQIHEYPKLVFNRANATSTDTIHRVRFKHARHSKRITVSFLNSMTFAFSEVMGRSYGGGVLELEPNEAEQLPLPFFDDAIVDFDKIDRLERKGSVDAILRITDKYFLRNRLGFDPTDERLFKTIWRKLCGRRVGRK